MSPLQLLCQQLADKAHSGQIRTFGADKGKPYVVHTRRVASHFPDNDILACAAELHDVLEDTSATSESLISAGVPVDVVKLVNCLTRLKGENYFGFIIRIMSSGADAIRIKIADIEDNLTSCSEGSRADKYRFALHLLRARLIRNTLPN